MVIHVAPDVVHHNLKYAPRLLAIWKLIYLFATETTVRLELNHGV